MPLLIIYSLKFSIGLAVAWLFYQGVLRRLTFYSWNRWYLLGYTSLCFFIPLINVQRVVESGPFTTPGIIRYIPVFQLPARDHSWDLVIFLLVAVSAILLIRLVIGWLSVRKMRRHATPVSGLAMTGKSDPERMQIYQVEEKIVPFSFGNAIYINQDLHTEKEYEEIILHEFVHIRQRHSVDILAAELMCVFAWYNPFAWLIRHSIRQNLEFIADSKVLEKGFDKKGYQYHLLKVIGEPKYRLATNFNFSSLKKRIVMMNKIRSARLHLVKFLFV
ncbi:MAG TPA: M56 family metallopeptidase, partial [Puia sp.]